MCFGKWVYLGEGSRKLRGIGSWLGVPIHCRPSFYSSLSQRMLSLHICPADVAVFRQLPSPISPDCSSCQWDRQSSGNWVSPQTYPPRSHISERRPEETQLKVRSAPGTPTALASKSSASVCFLLVPPSASSGLPCPARADFVL